MPRFYIEPEAMEQDVCLLTGDDHRHIAYALRMAVGDEITLCDGAGRECTGRLIAICKEETEVALYDRRAGASELPVSLLLYQGNPKGDKLEWIVQKSVELGAAAVIPFESSRCITRLRPERAEKQIARLSRVAKEAAGQCGRARLPVVEAPLSFAAALSQARERADTILFCYEGEKTASLCVELEKARARGDRTIAFFVGSEGGFSPEEVEAAVAAGAISVSLGRRILRCETAPLFALSCAVGLYEW